MTQKVTITGKIIPGHGVASGAGGDPRFPDGTIRMQMPFFKTAGLDLSAFYPGTLNVSISPSKFEVVRPAKTIRAVKWCATEPAEDFSFFDCEIRHKIEPDFSHGLIYYPHPDTKPEHFQPPDVLEILAPRIANLKYESEVELRIPADQIRIR